MDVFKLPVLGIQSTIFGKVAKTTSEPLEIVFEKTCQRSGVSGLKKPNIVIVQKICIKKKKRRKITDKSTYFDPWK